MLKQSLSVNHTLLQCTRMFGLSRMHCSKIGNEPTNINQGWNSGQSDILFEQCHPLPQKIQSWILGQCDIGLA